MESGEVDPLGALADLSELGAVNDSSVAVGSAAQASSPAAGAESYQSTNLFRGAASCPSTSTSIIASPPLESCKWEREATNTCTSSGRRYWPTFRTNVVFESHEIDEFESNVMVEVDRELKGDGRRRVDKQIGRRAAVYFHL